MTKPATALEVAQPSAVRLAAVGLQATVCASEALSITSLRHDGEELVVEPDQLPPAFRVHDAFAGITLMHPWANRLGQDSYTVAGVRAAVAADDPAVTRDANGLAIHGLRAPAGAWRLSRVSPASARAVLSSAANSAFPFPHELEVAIAVTTERLAVTTVLRPSGDLAVPVTFGWHPYFRPPGAERATWRLALPRRRPLSLSPEGIPTGASATEPAEDAPLGARTFDDGWSP